MDVGFLRSPNPTRIQMDRWPIGQIYRQFWSYPVKSLWLCSVGGLHRHGHGQCVEQFVGQSTEHGHIYLLEIDAFFKIWIRRMCVCCIRSFIFELFLGSVYDMCTGTWSPMSQHLWRFGQSRGRWKWRGQFLSDENGVYDTIIMIESGLKWMVERDESERI